MAVEREVLDWGVRLTARPFTGANAALVIKSEIAVHKPGKGSEVRITFAGMAAIINETRSVVANMKAEATKGESKKKR
jgi:hypothetical protein